MSGPPEAQTAPPARQPSPSDFVLPSLKSDEDTDSAGARLLSALDPAAQRDRVVLVPLVARSAGSGLSERGCAHHEADGPPPGSHPHRSRRAAGRGFCFPAADACRRTRRGQSRRQRRHDGARRYGPARRFARDPSDGWNGSNRTASGSKGASCAGAVRSCCRRVGGHCARLGSRPDRGRCDCRGCADGHRHSRNNAPPDHGHVGGPAEPASRAGAHGRCAGRQHCDDVGRTASLAGTTDGEHAEGVQQRHGSIARKALREAEQVTQGRRSASQGRSRHTPLRRRPSGED